LCRDPCGDLTLGPTMLGSTREGPLGGPLADGTQAARLRGPSFSTVEDPETFAEAVEAVAPAPPRPARGGAQPKTK